MEDFTLPEKWLGKRFFSLDAYLKYEYHEKLYKIALNAGLTCPNRDGTLDNRGCIFCSAGGSGDFAISRIDCPTIQSQLEAGKNLFQKKNVGNRYIAYFQAFTNTYGEIDYLQQIYEEALRNEQVAGISIATRPDCLGCEVLALLQNLKHQYTEKFIWIELGLQTIHEDTAKWMRRGYNLPVFKEAINQLKAIGIPVIVHVIIGLPKETKRQLLETIQYLNGCHIDGIKLQLLHYLKGTDLGTLYEKGFYQALTLESYIDQVICALEILSPDIVVHRVTGDGDKSILLAPLWSMNKRNVLNKLNQELRNRKTYQGRCYNG